MTYQTIDEDRGAQKAADLRRRFRKVSNASLSNRQFGLWPASRNRILAEAHSRQSHVNEFLLWCAFAAVVIFAGVVLF